MNCCTATGQCADGFNCPAHTTQPVKTSRCEQLGVCQGLGADQCPDCDSFECEVSCTEAPAPTRPLAGVAYPFAPGVIQRAADTMAFDDNDNGFPLDLRELLWVFGLVIVFSGAGGLLAAWLIGRMA